MRQQLRQPDRRPVGQTKGYSHETSTQKRELDNSSKPNRIRANGSPPEKATMDKKELLTLAPGDACRWEKLKLMKI
jgi:hypothetical protein